MKSTVIGNHVILHGTADNTSGVGTSVSAVPCSICKTIRHNVPNLKIIIQSQVTSVIMSEKGIDLRVGICFLVCAVERWLKRLNVGGERRHHSLITDQRHGHMRRCGGSRREREAGIILGSCWESRWWWSGQWWSWTDESWHSCDQQTWYRVFWKLALFWLFKTFKIDQISGFAHWNYSKSFESPIFLKIMKRMSKVVVKSLKLMLKMMIWLKVKRFKGIVPSSKKNKLV